MADEVMRPKERSSTKQPAHTGTMGKIVGPTKTQLHSYKRKSSNPNKGIDGQLK